MKSISELVQEAHENAKSKGWWETDRGFGELIALMHSELSEALEDYRNGRDYDVMHYEWEGRELSRSQMEVLVDECGEGVSAFKPCGIPSELADVVIRVFDACGRYDIDLEQAIMEKMAYNATRPHKHGGKVI